MIHCYVYVYVPPKAGAGGYYRFDRTMPTENLAMGRVTELEKRGQQAVYLVNHLIAGAFY